MKERLWKNIEKTQILYIDTSHHSTLHFYTRLLQQETKPLINPLLFDSIMLAHKKYIWEYSIDLNLQPDHYLVINWIQFMYVNNQKWDENSISSLQMLDSEFTSYSEHRVISLPINLFVLIVSWYLYLVWMRKMMRQNKKKNR